jgi:hypothetical protein
MALGWLLGAITVLIYLFQRYQTPRDKHGVPYKLPPGPPGWPIIGNTFQFPTKDQEPVLTKLAHKYGEM